MGTVYAVGVGPGSPNYITETVKKIIIDSDIVVGYKYTLSTISTLTQNKEVYEITMENQEKTYQKIHQECHSNKEIQSHLVVLFFFQ